MADPNRPEIAPPRDEAIRWWDVFIAAFGGTFVGVLLTVAVGAAALLISLHRGFALRGDALIAYLTGSFWTNHAALVLTDLGIVAAVWLVARWRMPHPLARFFPPIAASTFARALLSGVALSLLLNGVNEVLSWSSLVTFEDTALDRALVPHTAWQGVASLAVVVLFAPFVEEFFFRGLFFAWLRQTSGAGLAIVVTAMVFAAVHGQYSEHPGLQGWIYTLELFIAGAVLAWWVARTGSLRASFATHAAYNAAATLLSVFLP